jgi:hypothetical protein
MAKMTGMLAKLKSPGHAGASGHVPSTPGSGPAGPPSRNMASGFTPPLPDGKISGEIPTSLSELPTRLRELASGEIP